MWINVVLPKPHAWQIRGNISILHDCLSVFVKLK